MKLLILRPEPGASQTARRAEAMGLDTIIASIFSVEPVEWQPPIADRLDAVIITSANAARLAGDQLRLFAHLPCYAVGETSAEAAREAGFTQVRTGRSDGEALLAMMAGQDIEFAFHPCGRDHIALSHPGIRIERRIVYASQTVERLPRRAEEAMQEGALTLLHSPRSAAEFLRLADEAGLDRSCMPIAAISEAAADAAGDGWLRKGIADEPRDHALLELAAKLCQRMARSDGK